MHHMLREIERKSDESYYIYEDHFKTSETISSQGFQSQLQVQWDVQKMFISQAHRELSLYF